MKKEDEKRIRELAAEAEFHQTQANEIRNQIIAFGDGENDIEMLLFAGISVAPKNAKENVKKIVKIVSDYTNDQSYISKFLKNYLFL